MMSSICLLKKVMNHEYKVLSGPHQVEAQQLLKQTVPQLGVIDLVLQAKICHQPHRLKTQRGLQFDCKQPMQ